MMTIDIHEAEKNFLELIDKVEKGEEVIITKSERNIVKLVSAKRQSGLLKGRIWISADFDGSLPDDLLAAFEGKNID